MSERIATKGRTLLYGLIIISVLLAATAQILLKHGMTQVTDHGAIPLALNRPVATFRRVAANAAATVPLNLFTTSIVTESRPTTWRITLKSNYAEVIRFTGATQSPEQPEAFSAEPTSAGILLVSRTHQSA